FYTSNEFGSTQIINKVGSGDCFMAGLIYGFYNDFDPDRVLEFATLAAFEKLFIESDTTNIPAAEILAKLNG
ncbi:MAG: carbohydrate kinase family protein, partial [Mucilaginibacter sp.]|nr:carbohydrate kinase family protein [Mucilaginibacter sp.]